MRYSFAALAIIGAVACSGSSSGDICGEGTHEQGKLCVADPRADADASVVTCGEGTVLIGTSCEKKDEPDVGGTPETSDAVAPVDVLEVADAPPDASPESLGEAAIARYEIRVPVTELPADGFSKIPILAIGTNADGTPSKAPVVLAVSRPDAGTISPASVTLTTLGATTYLTPCNSATTPTCVGTFTITLALAGDPTTPVARSVTLTLVAPTGVGSTAPCLGGGNVIFFDGDAGDYIHKGTDTIKLGTWRASPVSTDTITIHVDPSDPKQGLWWDLEFSSRAIPAKLAPQVYEGAERAPFASPGHPGIDLGGDGRGCNTISGRFQIETLEFSGSALKAFTATFEQHCEGGSAALRGCVHYEM